MLLNCDNIPQYLCRSKSITFSRTAIGLCKMTIESTFLYLQDLNNETLAHLDAENRRQTLEEEMEFMKKVHEQVNRDMLN